MSIQQRKDSKVVGWDGPVFLGERDTIRLLGALNGRNEPELEELAKNLGTYQMRIQVETTNGLSWHRFFVFNNATLAIALPWWQDTRGEGGFRSSQAPAAYYSSPGTPKLARDLLAKYSDQARRG